VVDPDLVPFIAPPGASALAQAHATAEQNLFALINSYRTSPYVWDDTLSQAAAWMAQDVAARDDYRYEDWSTRETFDQHRDSYGRDLITRLMDCGVTIVGPVGEDIDGESFGTASGDLSTLVEMQFAPEEADLITNPQYHRIGLARYYSPYAQTCRPDGTCLHMVWIWVLVVAA
jgi:hypothetical protein